MTLTRRQAIDLLDRHGVRPSRALGQNFVVDPNTVRRIVRLAAITPGDPVVEVGAGLGSLTLALAEAGADVTAVELDRHLLPVLDEVLGGVEPAAAGRARRCADSSTGTTCSPGTGDWQLVANLPYNVATPLVLDLLDGVAGDRPDAGDGAARGGRAAGGRAGHVRLRHPVGEGGVLGHRRGRRTGRPERVPAEAEGRVGARADRSPRRARPRLLTRTGCSRSVRAGFGQRRKMLRRSLAGLVDSR